MDILFGEIMDVIMLPEQSKEHSTDFIKIIKIHNKPKEVEI